MGEAVPGADEIDQHIAAFVDGNDDVVDGAPRPPGIFQGDLPPRGDGNLFRSNAEEVANDPQRKTWVAASVVFHQERQAAEDPVGIRADVEIAEAFGGRGQGNEGGEGVSAHVESVEIPAPLQRPFGAVEIGAHFVIAGVLPGRPTAGVLVEGEGETVGDLARGAGGFDQGLIVRGIEGCGKNEVIGLGGDPHGGEVAHHPGEMRAVEVIIVQLLDGGVVEIDVNNGVIVWGPEAVDGVAQPEEPVDHLSVPRREHPRQQPEAQVRGRQGDHDQKQGDLRLAPLAIGAQW